MGRRRSGHRSKDRKGVNRYNPNQPSWLAVHRPFILSPIGPRQTAAATRLLPLIQAGK